MIIESGIIIFLGFIFLLIKLPRRTALRLLGHPLLLDLSVSALALLVHWGTFSGVMAAAFAGLLMSVGSTTCRYLIGYIEADRYYPGIFRVKL